MPNICGSVRRKPKFAPDANSITLLGPGVAELTKAKAKKGRMKLYIRGTLATARQKEMAKPPTKKTIRQKNSGDTREDGIAAF
jgi:hypothetical protein